MQHQGRGEQSNIHELRRPCEEFGPTRGDVQTVLLAWYSLENFSGFFQYFQVDTSTIQ